jgi:hypothetical protein
MLAVLLSPIGRWASAALVVLALIGAAYLKGHTDAATYWKGQLAAYKAAEKIVSDAELARQKTEGNKALTTLQQQLEAAKADDADSDEAVRKLQAALAAKPLIPGRGATADDVDALNR